MGEDSRIPQVQYSTCICLIVLSKIPPHYNDEMAVAHLCSSFLICTKSC
jgi:hypothetical protein